MLSFNQMGGFQRFGLGTIPENDALNPGGLYMSLNQLGFLSVNNSLQMSWGYRAGAPSRAYFELQGGNPITPNLAVFGAGQADYQENIDATGAVVSRVDSTGAWHGPVIIDSPNGSHWKITVDDAGHVTATPQ